MENFQEHIKQAVVSRHLYKDFCVEAVDCWDLVSVIFVESIFA